MAAGSEDLTSSGTVALGGTLISPRTARISERQAQTASDAG